MKKLGIISGLILLMVSCGAPKMDAELIKSMTIGYERGVVAGIEIGDSFDDLKKNMHDGWELKSPEKSEFTTYLTSSFSKSYDMMNFISGSISFDSNDKVFEMSYSITAKKGNHLLMAEIQNALEKEFNSKYEVSEAGSWSFSGPNRGKYGVTMSRMEEADFDNKTFTVFVTQYSKL
jgi:hypothetical protein